MPTALGMWASDEWETFGQPAIHSPFKIMPETSTPTEKAFHRLVGSGLSGRFKMQVRRFEFSSCRIAETGPSGLQDTHQQDSIIISVEVELNLLVTMR